MLEKYPAVSRDENKLGSGRTCVDTEIGIALVGMYVGVSKVEFLVAVDELIVFRLRIKERFARNNVVGSLGAVYLFNYLPDSKRIRGSCRIERTAVCHKNRRFLRKYRVFLVESESLDESLFQSLEEEKRAAEEQDLALDSSALCKSRNGLVNYRLKNTCGDVLAARTLIQQRLNVGFRENSAS